MTTHDHGPSTELTVMAIHQWREKHPDTRVYVARYGTGDWGEVVHSRWLPFADAVNLQVRLPNRRHVVWGHNTDRLLHVRIDQKQPTKTTSAESS